MLFEDRNCPPERVQFTYPLGPLFWPEPVVLEQAGSRVETFPKVRDALRVGPFHCFDIATSNPLTGCCRGQNRHAAHASGNNPKPKAIRHGWKSRTLNMTWVGAPVGGRCQGLNTCGSIVPENVYRVTNQMSRLPIPLVSLITQPFVPAKVNGSSCGHGIVIRETSPALVRERLQSMPCRAIILLSAPADAQMAASRVAMHSTSDSADAMVNRRRDTRSLLPAAHFGNHIVHEQHVYSSSLVTLHFRIGRRSAQSVAMVASDDRVRSEDGDRGIFIFAASVGLSGPDRRCVLIADCRPIPGNSLVGPPFTCADACPAT